MFNFLANCPHIPNFSNLFGASQNEDEIQPYANFGLPEGVTNTENAEGNSAHDSTTNSAKDNSGTGVMSPSVLPQDQKAKQDSLCQDSSDDEGPWFYIPSGPFCDTQKKNIALAGPAAEASKQNSTIDEEVLCISGLADLKMPADSSPSLRSLHKAMDHGWVRFPEA